MARTLLPGHKPLNSETLDRFSVGPDNKLYIDGKKLVTLDLFESFKKAGWLGKTVASIAGVAAFLVAVGTVANLMLEWNDRYCLEPQFYSSASKCLNTENGGAKDPDNQAVGKGNFVSDAPHAIPGEGRVRGD